MHQLMTVLLYLHNTPTAPNNADSNPVTVRILVLISSDLVIKYIKYAILTATSAFGHSHNIPISFFNNSKLLIPKQFTDSGTYLISLHMKFSEQASRIRSLEYNSFCNM